MSAKSDDVRWYLKCADEGISPGRIKRMSRKICLVRNWDLIKVKVMRECLEQKFSQEPFRSMLLETGETYIQEGNFWGDTFWGVDIETGEGRNILGQLIMEIRAALKNEGK